MKKEIIASIDGMIKDNIKDSLSKKFYRYLKRQNVRFFVNQKESFNYTIVKKGDVISFEFIDTIQKDENEFDYNLKIVFENEDFIIIDKPSGLNTIPSLNEPIKSLYNALYTYLKKRNKLKTIHIITRLDKDTSGLVLVALNKECATLLNKNHSLMNKIYYAKIEGHLENNSIIIEKPIARVSGSTKRMVAKNGDYAKTEVKRYKVLSNNDILEVKIYTGRTHQIRVHLASIKHPILGDVLYGNKEERLYLHASKLCFTYKNKTWNFESKPEWFDA